MVNLSAPVLAISWILKFEDVTFDYLLKSQI